MVGVLKKYFKGDGVIWAVIVGLCIFSILAVLSSSGILAYRYKDGNVVYYFLKHSSFLIIGFIIIFIFHLIPYKYFSRLSQLLMYIAVPLLVLTLIIGVRLNEANRWLTIPGMGFTFQTSDFAKLALIMYLARVLSQKQIVIKDFKLSFIPLILPVIIVCLLILPANFSTAAILFITCITIMFVGRVRILHILLVIGIGVFIVAFFIAVAVSINKEGRIETWKGRIEQYMEGDSEGNYQVEQSKIAIVKGGLIGRGPGNSIQRNFLPHPYSDFIFAIIVEEYGLIGGIVVMFLYLYLLFRAGVIVRRCNRTFPAFLAIGLAIGVVFQAIVNMGVAVNIFPVTGQTLPFISMGGSSVLFTSSSLGIILSVSRSVKKQQENVENEQDEQEEENNY